MKILMLNPPFLKKFSRSSRSPAISKGGTIYYPIWLAYATGLLEKAGYEIKLLDAPAECLSHEEVFTIAKEYKPAIAVLDTSTASIVNDVECASKIKKLTGCYIVMVGPHVSALPLESMKMSESIDAIARREYDQTLVELAQALADGGERDKLKNILGLTFRCNKEIVSNPDRPFMTDLDSVPFVSEVYKQHLNIRNYFYAANLYPEVTIVTGRGCPFGCVYCVLPQVMNGRGYRYRSVDNVIEELKYVKREFPDVKEIFFEDDTLTVNRERCRELCKKIINEKIGIKWSCNSRADVDLETLLLMKQAGCRLLCVGFESGDQKVLDEMKKGLKLHQIEQFMKNVKQAKILVHGCFLVGNPGETKETLLKTLGLAKRLNPDSAQFFPIMVYPGTEAYRWAERENFLTTRDYTQWLTDEGLHNCVLSRPGLTDRELVQFCDRARRDYYLRPSMIAYKVWQALTDPREFMRLGKSLKIFWRYLWAGTFKN